jgi:translation initiation factor IF-2
MMNVKDYSLEIGVSVSKIIDKCKELGFDINSENDELDDEIIIILDNSFNTTEEENVVDSDLTIKYELEDRANELIETTGLKDESVKKQKLKKKDSSNKEEYKLQKKEIYKNKKKLESNKKVLEDNIVLYKNNMTVKELADVLNVKPEELVKKLVMMGLMISINQSITYEDAEVIVLDYGKTLKKEETTDISNFEEYEVEDKEEELYNRAPVVTIMGHVDHGKTSLLDYIRNTHVAVKEAGGITQAIGAYQVERNGSKITFIDTPGHAAFTEMRARGASITDIVVIIVAADDGVMPQTKEAVEHAKAAGVPIIVAINKIDKPTVNFDRIMSEMAELGLNPEEWGGDTIFCKISAKTGEGVDLLLDSIIALAEISDLKANPNRYGLGTVIEAKLDKNIGPTATLLIQNGTLRLGDSIVVGTTYGKIRSLKDSSHSDIVSAGASMPVEITGLNAVPIAGDKFMAFQNEKEARAVALKRQTSEKQHDNIKKAISLDELFSQIKEGKKEINVVLKTDVKGSEEAIKHTLEKIDVEGVKVKIIRTGVGSITESDIVLASASNAIIVGFNVVLDSKTKEIADYYHIDVRLYNVIYQIVEDIEHAMKGLLDPIYEEVYLGKAEVRKIFKFSKVGNIAGCHIIDGVVKSNSLARLIRDSKVIYTGKINSLQREKDSVKEVKKGFDCGITLENFIDIRENDIIEVFEMKEVER